MLDKNSFSEFEVLFDSKESWIDKYIINFYLNYNNLNQCLLYLQIYQKLCKKMTVQDLESAESRVKLFSITLKTSHPKIKNFLYRNFNYIFKDYYKFLIKIYQKIN